MVIVVPHISLYRYSNALSVTIATIGKRTRDGWRAK